MTSVQFENATIQDVIAKAAKVAPTKGSAFDKASGILIEVDAESEEVVVMATNTEIFYMEVVDTLAIEGPSRKWRLPSQVLGGICSKLPIGSGKAVTFDEKDTSIQIKSGRMRATVRTIDPTYYPEWEAFDPSDVESVNNFGGRIQMVQWAAATGGEPPMSGIHLDGQRIVATDRYKVAMAPCEAEPLYKPVTVPATLFTPLMKHLGDVKLGIDEDMLLVMPDEATQIRAVIYAGAYPNAAGAFKYNEPNNVGFKKQALLDIIDRAMVMAGHDRTPLLRMMIGKGEIAVMMSDREIGLLGDVIETPGYADHARHTICFTPNNLIGGLQASPNEDMTLYYDESNSMNPVRLDGGSGYEVLIMPRKDMEEDQE